MMIAGAVRNMIVIMIGNRLTMKVIRKMTAITSTNFTAVALAAVPLERCVAIAPNAESVHDPHCVVRQLSDSRHTENKRRASTELRSARIMQPTW